MNRIGVVVIFALSLWTTLSSATSPQQNQSFMIKPVVEGLAIVWGMDFISDNEILFTQRGGQAGIVDIKTAQVRWLTGLPEVQAQRQGGLLDVKKSPDFANTGWVYFSYAKPTFLSAVTTLARAKIEGSRLVDWQDLLITKSESFQNIHFGSRIAFDHSGHVYFSVGDRGSRNKAQQLTNHAGTIIRLKLDGSVPADNPFIDDANALPEIWSYGHRNPQGLVFDRQNQRLWSIEHGPKGGDEINLIVKGKNYGWPIVSQGREYFSGSPVGVRHKQGMQEPVKVYIPSIAPSDLLLYQANEFPDWQGSLFSGAMVLRHLNRVELNEDAKVVGEHRYLKSLKQRVRSLTVDKQGRLYVATDNGVIYQLQAAN